MLDSKGRGPPLELTIHVVVRYQAGKKWGKHGCQYLIYAALGEFSLKEIAARYRGRFGIESSYRILGQALARTSSRSPALRLLHVGVGMLLQNEWVLLKLLYASEGRQGPGGLTLREELLRFEQLLELCSSAWDAYWGQCARWAIGSRPHGGSGVGGWYYGELIDHRGAMAEYWIPRQGPGGGTCSAKLSPRAP